jgi:thiol-disulfide isomerase/thioredoxin
MKTLFFVLGILMGCKATPAIIKDTETNNVIIGAEDHTGSHGTAVHPPDGVIATSDCQHIDIGDKACNFRLLDQNRELWELYSHAGDIIVLDFSAVWCPPCQAAGYYSQPLQDDYANDGVQIVTILIDGVTHGVEPSDEEMDDWAAGHNITTAPVLQGSRDKMLDDTAIEGYALGGFPTYIYIGRDMKFFAGHVGFSEEYVRQTINGAL